MGAVILVQPGERVPIDGEVLQGSSSLNTSALTGGEPARPWAPETRSSAAASTWRAAENPHHQVLRGLDGGENSGPGGEFLPEKARSEQFITRFARYYTPIVCFSALALAVLPRRSGS